MWRETRKNLTDNKKKRKKKEPLDPLNELVDFDLM